MERSTTILVVCSIVLPVLFMVSTMYRNSISDLFGTLSKAKFLTRKVQNVAELEIDDKNGLVNPVFDERTCFSRFQSNLYRKISPQKPSPYLISKLRSYEDLHKYCGPHTESYNRTLKRLDSKNITSTNCKYIVWIPANGLGNRIISIASSFLYALLTNRVLLINHGTDMDDLFCEPFPNTSWLLPKDFPLKNQFASSKLRYAHSLGSLLKSSATINNSKELKSPSFLYLNLGHGDYDLDQAFYCNQTQQALQKIPWLFLLSDQYFAPSFFLDPPFKQEASKLFPEKETVFNHLGNYLFNPSNQAWGLITRFYQAYLAKADEKIGLQIRVFNVNATPFERVMDQILSCTMQEKLLPEVDTKKESLPSPSKNPILKAILITSLYPEFYENISNMYWTRPTVNGEVIEVYQPSHEEYQHFGDNMHNMKAWAEIYLLSLSDVLVISSWSTFGYVAQGLGGAKAWILSKPGHRNPPCQRAISMEPCFHFPPRYNCSSKNKIDSGDLAPYLRHCEDRRGGIKLVKDQEELQQ
ncbi:hypothetical protein P3X46_001706 [Hevea brasiliensis]|uniref:Fucosyltransferase n=2 Tax=Hevea brasiliensis TaxID=3981 RepID=A0ABQ9NDZ1_HEVBR|nr:galactoside 2-alpha-L-fucosyltransferase-like isoform X2 [Hevea brasiliensis]KAJ9190518.1 hypothetical protein P3X46_001706 [Hevea brasiliensis]